MAGYELNIVSWRGVSVNDGEIYRADLIREDNVFDGAAVQAIESQQPGEPPSHVRTQPQGDRFMVEVEMLGEFTQAALDQMKQWWSPFEQEAGYLIATPEGGGGNRRLLCVIERVAMQGAQIMHVFMRSATGLWEADTATTDSLVVTASGQTDTLVNDGSYKAYPTFTITPGTVMADSDSWIKRRRIHVANRSELPWTDPVGDGWPIDLAEDAWDTDALNTAGKVLSSLNDVRLIYKGREINRWMEPAGDNATSKMWANLMMRARKTATLAAAINASVTSLTVNNANLLQGWPQTGFFLLGSERIQYTARTANTMTIVRGSGNTTAASHSAGDTLYWQEMNFLDVIYDYSGAGDPAPPDDRKPRISLPDSTNTQFKWANAFLNVSDRRSAAWQPLWTDDGPTSDKIALFAIGGNLRFQDILPTSVKPNINNIYIDDPAGISTASGGLSVDEVIQANLRLNIYAIPLLGGAEVLVDSWNPDENSSLATRTETLAGVAARIRLNARIGVLCGVSNDDYVDYLEGEAGPGDLTMPDNPSTDEPDLSSYSFVCDREEAPVLGYVVRVGDTRHIRTYSPPYVHLSAGTRYHAVFYKHLTNDEFTVFIAKDSGGVADNSFHADLEGWAIAGGFPFTHFLDKGLHFPSITTFNLNMSTFSRQYFVERGTEFPLYTPAFRILTDSNTDAQADAPSETEEYIDLNNIILKRDSTRTPKIVFAPEEVCYLLNARIKNDTTGAYLDLFYPMKLGENIVIDCANKTVTAGETGVQIPFICTPSDPSEWLYNQPGSNTYSYTEAGVVSTTLAHSFRSRWL